METSLDRLSEGLSTIRNGSHTTTIWNLDKYERLIEKSLRIIDSTEKNLLVSVWHEEMKELHTALINAEKRGVQIGVIHFGEHPQLSAGVMFPHPIADTLYKEKGGRGIAIVSDAASALIGTIYGNGHVEGGWSESKGFVILTEDYIKHDIYIMKIVSRYDRELIERFGENYYLLRDVFSDREL
jgi:sugar-specific transcriptional regulator TrmB